MRKKLKLNILAIILISIFMILIGCNRSVEKTMAEKAIAYCSNCGAESYEKSEYCSNCGAKCNCLNEKPEIDENEEDINEDESTNKDKLKKIKDDAKIDLIPEEPPKYTNPVEPPEI